jgi:hypothetical protein
MIYCLKTEFYSHKFNEIVKIYFLNSTKLCPFRFSPLRHCSALYACPLYKGIIMVSQSGDAKNTGGNCSAPRNTSRVVE